MRIVSETEFSAMLAAKIMAADTSQVDFVTGPGRSGAIAAVYASHLLGIPFVPFKIMPTFSRALIVDTATETGRTIKKAASRYIAYDPVIVIAFAEPPRVAFWYEAQKPQRYRHERVARNAQ